MARAESLEMRRRLEALLEADTASKLPPDAQRARLALSVLQRLGTPEAREALAEVARKAPDDWLGRAAATVRDRAEKRP